jgi:predicted kinase
MAATDAAFDRLHDEARSRLAAGRLTVVDATNVQRIWRATLLGLARTAAVPAVAIVFDLPVQVLRERHAGRSDRPFGSGVIHAQRAHLRRSLETLDDEGFEAVRVLRSVAESDGIVIVRSAARPPLGPSPS